MGERCRVLEMKRWGSVSLSKYLVCLYLHFPLSDPTVPSGEVHLFILYFQRGMSSFP